MMYFGVVEDRLSDPLKLGRCRVRVVGVHSEDKVQLPTDHLPWAIVMTPIDSASNSGVGVSPVGIVEGTWVAVVFRDEYKQHPIIIGTLPGIPEEDARGTPSTPPTPAPGVVSSDGTAVTDGSGNPISSGEPAPARVTEPVTTNKAPFNRPSAFTFSNSGFEFLKKEEALSSVVEGKNRIAPKSAGPGTIIYSYQDPGGVWTVGYGNTFIGNKRVDSNTRITKAQAEELLLASVRDDHEKATRRLIKVPVTQSMFDACVSMIYNSGQGNFGKSQVLQALNARRYEEASVLISKYATSQGGKVLGGLIGRRGLERGMFLRDGIPKDDGTVEKLAGPEQKKEVDATQNPVVIRGDRFTPSAVYTEPKQPNNPGFKDPTGKYPLYVSEPDTHRLARHENIDGTIILSKESARVRAVPTADGKTWDQSAIPYNAKYPYNKVTASESGHIFEVDDTPENERIHQYHKTGTYHEIDRNGTSVRRIVGDDFEILERNGNVLVRGNCNVTIQGNSNIRVENNSTMEVLGNLDLKVGGNIGIGAGGNVRISAGGEFSVDASRVDLNSGKGGSVLKASGGATGAKEFPVLVLPSRFAENTANYETPEEGDAPPEFQQQAIQSGEVDPDDTPPPVEEKGSAPCAGNNNKIIDPGCDLIFSTVSFTPSFRLSENFTLGQFVKGEPVPTGTNYGNSPQEIVCNLKYLCINVLEPIRLKYPNLRITSGWRSEKKNSRLPGASKKSKHLSGQAVDIVFDGFSRQQTYDACVELPMFLPDWDQVLLEYSGRSMWIHIGLNRVAANRRQGKTMQVIGGKTTTTNTNGFTLLA